MDDIAVPMVTDFDERMAQWRQGLLSDGEIMGHILSVQTEIWLMIKAKEEAIAEKRFEGFFGKSA